MSRGRTEKLAAVAIAQVASTVARFAADVVHYASQNFRFIKLPDAFTTGSSIMPHKKNPDVFEVLRARCNRLQSVPTEIGFVLTNLPSGYHRDLQFIKDRIVPAIDELTLILRVLTHVAPHIQPIDDILENGMYQHLFSVDRVDELVRSGVPFRDAYRQVAQEISDGAIMRPLPSTNQNERSALGSIGNVGIADLRKRL